MANEPLKSFLDEYTALNSGKSHEFVFDDDSRKQSRTGGPIKSNFIPFVITMVPPVDIPSGKTKTREIPAPQQIETTLTKIPGEDVFPPDEENPNDDIREDREQFIQNRVQGEQRFQGAPDQEDVAARDVIGSPDADEEGGVADSTIETQVSVSNLAINPTEAGNAFTEYLSNLEDRYNDFQDAAVRSDKRLEEENTPQVEGREFEDDDVARRREELEKARELGEDANFIRRQALIMRNLPPLLMYINPSEFSISYDHVSSSTKTRDGHIVENWGLEQPDVSASGKVGGFYADGYYDNGLATRGRQASAAYQSFMNLFKIYRQNGNIYNSEGRIAVTGSVRILYDDVMYVGSFDELSISESEEEPFTFDYDFSFTVRYRREMV